MSGTVQEAPAVALGITTPPALNPFGLATQATNLQSKMLANQLSQAQLFARQRAGEIMAAAPDLNTGLQQITKDRNVAPYAGELLSSYRQMEQFMLQNQGIQAGQARDATTGLLSRLPGVYNAQDPVQALRDVVGNIVQGMPKEMQQRTAPALRDITNGLLAGVPTAPDPGESPQSYQARSQAAFKANVAGFAVSGVPGGAEGLKAVLPTTGIQDTGKVYQPYVQDPGFKGGSLYSAPGSLPHNLGPTLAPPGQIPVGGNYGLGGADTGGGGAPPPSPTPGLSPSNPLIGGLPGAPPPGLGMPPGPTPNSPRGDGWGQGAPGAPGGVAPGVAAPRSPSQGPADPGSRILPDGIPLVPPGFDMTAPYASTGTGGVRIEGPSMQNINNEGAKNLVDSDKKEYLAAAQGAASLKLMNAEFDDATKSGFSSPGSMQPFRLALGKAMDFIQGVTGSERTIDPSALASAQGINELSNRLGVTLTSQLLGSQREAAETIRNVTSSVPGLSDTLLGAKLKLATLQALVQRQMDGYEFKNEFAAQNAGDTFRSDVKFNQAHPPELMADQIMKQFGLGTDGKFNTPQAIISAYHQGLLTREKAAELGKQQFPNGF